MPDEQWVRFVDVYGIEAWSRMSTHSMQASISVAVAPRLDPAVFDLSEDDPAGSLTYEIRRFQRYVWKFLIPGEMGEFQLVEYYEDGALAPKESFSITAWRNREKDLEAFKEAWLVIEDSEEAKRVWVEEITDKWVQQHGKPWKGSLPKN